MGREFDFEGGGRSGKNSSPLCEPFVELRPDTRGAWPPFPDQCQVSQLKLCDYEAFRKERNKETHQPPPSLPPGNRHEEGLRRRPRSPESPLLLRSEGIVNQRGVHSLAVSALAQPTSQRGSVKIYSSQPRRLVILVTDKPTRLSQDLIFSASLSRHSRNQQANEAQSRSILLSLVVSSFW